MVNMIVAYNKNFVIGDKFSKVPWHIPQELKFFKETTTGHACLMGRKTWESIPAQYRPLSERLNLIVSKDPEKVVLPEPKENAMVYVGSSIESCLDLCSQWLAVDQEVFIIGGAQVYRYCLDHDLVDRVLVSEIKGHLDVDGAAFFPDLTQLGWASTVMEEFDEFTVKDYKRANT